MTEKQINSMNFNPGGLVDIPDYRDLKWSDIGAAVSPFDWSSGYDIRKVLRDRLQDQTFSLPVKDQNGSGSCGGQAAATYDAVLEAIATRTHEERSAKYIIAQTFVLDGNGAMLGSRMRDNAEIVIKQGVAREAVLPSYSNGKPPTDSFMNKPQDITEVARADAKASRAKSYASVNTDIDSFAQAISSNYGIISHIGGENNGTWFSKTPQAPTTRRWSHFMYWGAPQLINGKKGIWGLQSWGKDVGENGWQWFSESFFKTGFVYAGQTMVFDDTVAIPTRYTFTRDLRVNSTGVDVKFLQRFLNTHGSPVATSGVASLGNETSFFGELTKIALAKFQKDNGVSPATGYFGPLTRAKVNQMQ